MFVGIIAEGRADLAVLTNILKGWLDLDSGLITYLRPEYSQDETDLHAMRGEQRGGYLYVIEECRNRKKIDIFLNATAEEKLLLLHLDAAEAYRTEFGLEALLRSDPPPTPEVLRESLIDRISEWMGQNVPAEVRFAIAVQETDAWLLPLYDESPGDTSRFRNVKERLDATLARKRRGASRLNRLPEFEKYRELSKDLRKRKNVARCARHNISLRLFCASLSSPSSTSD